MESFSFPVWWAQCLGGRSRNLQTSWSDPRKSDGKLACSKGWIPSLLVHNQIQASACRYLWHPPFWGSWSKDSWYPWRHAPSLTDLSNQWLWWLHLSLFDSKRLSLPPITQSILDSELWNEHLFLSLLGWTSLTLPWWTGLYHKLPEHWFISRSFKCLTRQLSDRRTAMVGSGALKSQYSALTLFIAHLSSHFRPYFSVSLIPVGW